MVIGSFLNVLIYRVPRGRSIVRPPSSCPTCGTRIRSRDNIPILSYLLLRGRCRSCGERISPRYPAVELLSGLIPLAVYWRVGMGSEFAVLTSLAYVLVVLSFIDIDERILPDRITLPGIAVGLVVSPLAGVTTLTQSLIGAVAGGGALFVIGLVGDAVFKKESMGGGDVKLAAMLGAFLGWRAVVVGLFAAFLLGAIVGVGQMAGRRPGKESEGEWDHTLPFGPFIALGGFISALWGNVLISWYQGLFI
ncbi:MAG: prepilin peptidase [Candidatus Eisenbacteria bacterium]|nr:prepilin peptidase [Candidatus Eisenbacteria bacterium]